MARLLFPLLLFVLGISSWILIGSNSTNKPSLENFPTPPAEVQIGPHLSSLPTPTSTPKSERSSVLIDVPFVSQAPTGNWNDPREQDGCEEAASYQAILWAKGEKAPDDLNEQEQKLLAISDWEEKNYGSYHDTNVEDTIDRIYKKYFEYENVKISNNVSIQSIKQELSNGNIIQVPADGQALGNPYFTPPGPDRHNLLIIGYDNKTKEFITNDNGTKRGKNYKYKYEVLLSAIRDYPTGNHKPITESKKDMIVISKIGN